MVVNWVEMLVVLLDVPMVFHLVATKVVLKEYWLVVR